MRAARTRLLSVISMCWPVLSPPAWRMRGRLWAASRARAISPSSGVKGHAKADQVGDALRGLGHQDAHRLFVAQAVAGGDGVLEVQLGESCGLMAAAIPPWA